MKMQDMCTQENQRIKSQVHFKHIITYNVDDQLHLLV